MSLLLWSGTGEATQVCIFIHEVIDTLICLVNMNDQLTFYLFYGKICSRA